MNVLALDSACAACSAAVIRDDAVLAERLYILPHEESRKSIRRRFERIDRTFEEQGSK